MTSSLVPLVPRLVSRSCGLITELARVFKDPDEPELPFIYRAELGNHTFVPSAHQKAMVGSGKGFDRDSAMTGALGEAIERYSASLYDRRAIHHARRDELDGESLDPEDLVLFAPHQYEQLRFSPWDPNAPIGWVRGRTYGRDEAIWLPALAVYLSYEARQAHEFLFPVTSNGLACGPNVEWATLKAALEVIERDAFLTMWHMRVPPRRLSLQGHPDADLQSLATAYHRRGVEIEVYRLQTDLPVVVAMALGVDANGREPAVVVGLGAALDATDAVRGAVLEVAQVRPALRIRSRAPESRQRLARLLANTSEVTELEDHDLLYTHPSMLHRFDFIRDQDEQPVTWQRTEADHAAQLGELATTLATAGYPLHWIDVTPSEIRELGLRTVRVVIPRFQPIHFGASEIRLGGRRMYELAAHLLQRARLDWRDVDLTPHPLS